MASPELERLDQIIAKMGDLVDVLKDILMVEYSSMPEDEKCHCSHVEDMVHADS